MTNERRIYLTLNKFNLYCKKSSPQFWFDGYLVEENKEKFMKIKDAYKILIDDQKREEYNNKIGKKFRGFLEFSLF